MSRSESADESSVEQLRERVENPVWRLVGTYCRPYLHYVAFSVLTIVVAQVLWLFSPVVLGVAFDAIFLGDRPYRLPFVPGAWVPETTTGQFAFSLAAIACSKLGGSAVYLVGSWAREMAAYRIQHDLRTDAYAAVQGLDFGFFENQQTGELLSILNNDVNQLEGFLTGTVQQAANATFIAVGVGGYMVMLSPQLALVALVAPLVGLGVNYWYSRRVEPNHQARREEVGDINTRIENNLGGMRLVKVYNRESYERERVADASEKYKAVSWALGRAKTLFGRATGSITSVGYVLVFFVGGYWVLREPPLFFRGSLAAGTVLTFLVYNGRFHWPVRQVTSVVDSYQETKASCGRVLGLLDRPRAVPERPDAVDLHSIEGRVEYDEVSFAYDGTDEPALSEVSFEAEPGETIGLVGATGAGKSTALKLLFRFYDVDGGSIRVDGHDVRDLSLEGLRRGIGYVGQEPYLFDGTVRENVAYSRPNAAESAVEAATRRAGAHAFVSDLADGYDTQVGERGVKLSGGQRQRIAIARAVLDDPEILVLDEATSHVDNETEAVIQDRLADLVADRTTFAIAHRLSTVRNADQILVLDDGVIVERGTHEELLGADGLYANLWNVQVGDVDSLPDEFVRHVTGIE